MQFVADLWLPILLSGVAVFILSAISHAALPFHQKEWGKLSNEDAALDVIRAGVSGPGLYSAPSAADGAAKSPDVQAKMARGPIAFITVLPPGMPNMGKMMGLSLVYNIIVSVFIAYIASHTIAAGAEYLTVFRVTGTVAFMAYALSSAPDSIWFGKPWSSYVLMLIDALVYALVVGGIFGWRWV
jgi:hypothetical protein